LTTRVAHGKARVRLGGFQKINRQADFDKNGTKWVMVPANAIKQHRILEERLVQAKQFAEHSRFNTLEDNHAAIGIVGSGVAYYYARSLLEPKKFSWLKLGFVNPFPSELVKDFAGRVKKIIVLEELRPYIEGNMQRLGIPVVGKAELGLEEIGEFTPDNVRSALATLDLTTPADKPMKLELQPRPPALCPGCPHRAFYYSLSMIKQAVQCDNDRCVGCGICEYMCSFIKEGVFNPLKARIRTVNLDEINSVAVACRACTDPACVAACPEGALSQSKETGLIQLDEIKCIGCDWCVEACKYGALTRHPVTNKPVVCDICGGEPKCVSACPEGALTLTGRSDDKIVTGDIGCYTLGVLPPVKAVQTCLCMGAGISQAAGMVHAGVKDKVFAVIGDSTFFHGGMPGLLNIVYNNANVCVVVMDNTVVAMTGHQPTPGSGKTVMGEDAKIINIKDIAHAVGIEKVTVVDPYDVKSAIRALRETMQYDGPSVIISKRPCPLLVERNEPREVTDKCKNCGVCAKSFGCPAISLGKDKAQIDPTLCYGCGVCETICPFNAIRKLQP
jgi:TPP-dependent indolepyruvate ferredoxin oxidoreductase alpha subunit